MEECSGEAAGSWLRLRVCTLHSTSDDGTSSVGEAEEQRKGEKEEFVREGRAREILYDCRFP